MPEIRMYGSERIRIGCEWPMSLDAELTDGHSCLVFTGMIQDESFRENPACGVQIRRFGERFAVIFLKYSDSQVPLAWRDRELLWEHRPESWPKEDTADGQPE